MASLCRYSIYRSAPPLETGAKSGAVWSRTITHRTGWQSYQIHSRTSHHFSCRPTRGLCTTSLLLWYICVLRNRSSFLLSQLELPTKIVALKSWAVVRCVPILTCPHYRRTTICGSQYDSVKFKWQSLRLPLSSRQSTPSLTSAAAWV